MLALDEDELNHLLALILNLGVAMLLIHNYCCCCYYYHNH